MSKNIDRIYLFDQSGRLKGFEGPTTKRMTDRMSMKIQQPIDGGLVVRACQSHVFKVDVGPFTFLAVLMIGIQFDLKWKRKARNNFRSVVGQSDLIGHIHLNLD